jgi:NADH-quinone oxidoreductase subunit A
LSESFSFISPADVFLRKFLRIHASDSVTHRRQCLQFRFRIFTNWYTVDISAWLGPKRKTSDKLENFASGIESHGNARQPMAIKYFLVAILFVLFDVEVIFFYPYAVNFRELGWSGFGAVLMFVGFFLAGFIYIIKKGALTWED